MKKKKFMTVANRKKLCGFTFLIPFLLGFAMFFVAPISKTFFYSFNKIGVGDAGGMTFEWVGVQNYIDLFVKEVTTESKTMANLFANQNTDMLISVPLITIFSLFLALLANMNFKGRSVVRTIFFLPIVLGLPVVTGALMASTGSETVIAGGGLFRESLILKLMVNYTDIPLYILSPIIGYVDNIFELISDAGVQTLVYLTALQSISPSLYEVAKIEGATAYETFWKVTIPSIINITFFVVVYTIVDLFLNSKIAEEVHSFAFTQNKIGVGSALSMVYIVNVLLVLGIVFLLFNKIFKKYR